MPTAFFIGSPTRSTSAGTIRKPPPTPAMPVSRPTPIAAAEVAITDALRGLGVVPAAAWAAAAAASRRPLRNMNTAAMSITTAKRMSWKVPEMNAEARAPA